MVSWNQGQAAEERLGLDRRRLSDVGDIFGMKL